ncbi:MAG: 30S ribosome-binding factor RbfA [Acidobacteria bacterium]|nr:30S ribosome-binding factor RbfA [Acidobacteriota bacterium]
MQYRPHRLAEELKNEISAIILQQLHDPRVGFATVTKVKVSPDLRYAHVFVSVFGSAEEKKQTLDALKSATGFIRKQVGSRIRLRHTPELTFAYDESVEQGDRMLQLIDEINRE